jgi:hypothetical protein
MNIAKTAAHGIASHIFVDVFIAPPFSVGRWRGGED